MSIITVGLVDYDVGNYASIADTLRSLGYRVRISSDPLTLDQADILILPGVGAFPAAMKALHQKKLVKFLLNYVKKKRPIIGICLGMQILASSSCEGRRTSGLNIIPGKIISMKDPKYHIGWNSLDCKSNDPLFKSMDKEEFYFNHSYYYSGPEKYQLCLTYTPQPMPAVIRKGNVIGLQFHPEKSQHSGVFLLKKLILNLVKNA